MVHLSYIDYSNPTPAQPVRLSHHLFSLIASVCTVALCLSLQLDLLRRWELPKKEMADLATAVRKLARVLWALHVTFQQVRLPARTCNLEPAHLRWALLVTSSR